MSRCTNTKATTFQNHSKELLPSVTCAGFSKSGKIPINKYGGAFMECYSHVYGTLRQLQFETY